MVERHLHWRFVAYNGEPYADKTHWAVTVEVIGYLTEADAQIAVSSIVQREQYIIVSVSECTSCGFHTEYALAMKKIAEQCHE